MGGKFCISFKKSPFRSARSYNYIATSGPVPWLAPVWFHSYLKAYGHKDREGVEILCGRARRKKPSTHGSLAVWLGVGGMPNHLETWAAVPFGTKNCRPNWHQTVLGGENWPTTCAQHVGTTWQTFLPNYLVGSFITTLRLCVRKLKAPTLILHLF